MSNKETNAEAVSNFNSENLTVTVTKNPHCQIKFDITVTPKATAAAYEKAIRNINKEVNIPGFRKGKAPTSMIVEKYGSAIHKEFVDQVVQIGFNESLQLANIHVLRDGRFSRPIVHECKADSGARFTIEFESKPSVPSIDQNKLHLKKIESTQVTDQDIQNALQNLLLQFANYEPIQDRAVQEEDFVDLDVTILEETPQEVIRNQRAQVIPTGLPNWLREKVIGLHAGESAEGMTQQDSTLATPTPDFKSLPFKVTVKAIWNGNLPAIDEELAKKVGLTSVDELMIKMRERLEKESEEEARAKQFQLLEEVIVAEHPFDIPQSYIDANKESRLEHYLQREKKSKKDYSQEEFANIYQLLEESAIYQLKLFFLLHKASSEHQISPSSDDLQQELTRQISLMSVGRNQINFSGEKEKLHEDLYQIALERKTKEFLLNVATFSD